MADYRKSSVHCHSTLCDGKNTLQEMAGAACAQGLTTLGFSGHSYTTPDREYCMTPGRTAQYRATIAKLKNEYRGKVDILCGIEWDLLSEGTPKGFDYWIGSAHHLYGKNTEKYYEIDFRPEDLRDCINNDFDGDPLAAVEAYFAEVEKIAAKKPDILGHIDLVKKLNADGSFFDEESPRYKAAALRALQAVRENDCMEIISLLGGRAAEELVIKDITTGASNDIERATSMARDMVTKYGMSELLGPIQFGGDNDEVFIGRDWGHARNYGEGVAATIDQEVNRIVTDAYREAKRLLQENMEMLHATAKLLVEKEKVTGDEFRSLFDQKVRNEVLGIANEAEQPTETAENREEN